MDVLDSDFPPPCLCVCVCVYVHSSVSTVCVFSPAIVSGVWPVRLRALMRQSAILSQRPLGKHIKKHLITAYTDRDTHNKCRPKHTVEKDGRTHKAHQQTPQMSPVRSVRRGGAGACVRSAFGCPVGGRTLKRQRSPRETQERS